MEREHFYSANTYYKNTFGAKVYRLPIDGGFTCPNRDGHIGIGGCYFCSAAGSGDFTPLALSGEKSIDSQIEIAKSLVKDKKPGKYMAYLQAFTNTYAPLDYLEDVYRACLSRDDIAALSLGTRPDCVDQDVALLISSLSAQYNKPVYVELGLQTIHDKTEKYLGRGYSVKDFEKAFKTLDSHSIPVIVHLIIGLPGEDTSDMIKSVQFISGLGVHGVKISLLNIVKDTVMEKLYYDKPDLFSLLDLDGYIEALGKCIEHLRSDIVVYRLTGDAPKKILTAPLFAGNKKLVLNSITKYLKDNNIYQGSAFQVSGGNNAT